MSSQVFAVTLLPLIVAGAASGQATRAISGHLYDTRHSPLANALVGVRTHLDGSTLVPSSRAKKQPWAAGVFVRSDPGGAFRILVPSTWGAYADSTLDVIALVPKYALYAAAAPPGASTVDVTLMPAMWRAYTIAAQTPNGRPATDAVARAVVGMDDSAVIRAAADSAGQMTFLAPVTSPIVVTVTTPGYRPVVTNPFFYADTTKNHIAVTLLPVMHGVVRDANGRPAPSIGVFWSNSDLLQTVANWKFVNQSGPEHLSATTDAAGRYTMAPPVFVDPESKPSSGLRDVRPPELQYDMIFADSLFTLLAFARIDAAPPGATSIMTEVALQRTRDVRVPIVEPPRSAASGTGLSVSIEAWTARGHPGDSTTARPIRVADFYFRDSSDINIAGRRREARFYVAPGWYRTVTTRTDVRDEGAWFRVSSGSGPFLAPEQRPRILALYATHDHLAPELKATNLDGNPVRLADYRGKVVVLDFWGYWCGPCISSLKANLVPFAKEYAGKPVVVLALHDASVRNRVEYDMAFARLKRIAFDGRDLPMPVLLDEPTADERGRPVAERAEGSGETTTVYGVTGFPATFLIDARGALIGRVSTDSALLRQSVDRLLREAVPVVP